MYATDNLTNSYNQARTSNANLIETLKAQTAGLVNRLAEQGVTPSYQGVSPEAARAVMDNQLTIRRMQQREQQRLALNNDVGSALQSQYLPHRVMENAANAATKVQAAANLAGTLTTGTHDAMPSNTVGDLASQLATISGLQAGGMGLGQALSHVAGDTLAPYQPSTFEDMKAKIERQYVASGASIPMNGFWNPR